VEVFESISGKARGKFSARLKGIETKLNLMAARSLEARIDHKNNRSASKPSSARRVRAKKAHMNKCFGRYLLVEKGKEETLGRCEIETTGRLNANDTVENLDFQWKK